MSDVWVRKVRTFFKKLATNGLVTQTSYENLGGIFCDIGRWRGSVKEQQVRRFMIQIWNDFFERGAVNGAVDEAMFVALVRVQTHKVLPRAAVQFYGILFDAIDRKGRGVVNREEFSRFTKAFGIFDWGAEDAFNAIDQNHDGKLSKEEFVSAGVEYWCTDDETYLSKLMLGPLVN